MIYKTTTHPQLIDSDEVEPHQPPQLPVGITKSSPTNGVLIGVPPTTFDGDRSKGDRFMTQFGLFCIINGSNAAITNPTRRVALALTYIRGPKVDAWVTQQYDSLSIKANHARTHSDTDEALWEDFVAEFKRTFAEPKWEVFDKLKNLQMSGDDIEMYIATFEDLMRRAKCTRESGPISMARYFREGLPTDLVRSIMKRQAIPSTIDEWESAARKEVETEALKKFYLPAGSEGDTPARTGATRLLRWSVEERERLMAEGRCFECNEKGHRARDCPDNI